MRSFARSRLRGSPLLSALPKGALPKELERRCHIALAMQLLKSPVDQDSGSTLVAYWFAADEPDKAGITLATLLDSLEHEQGRVPPGMLLAIGRTTPLPPAMSLSVQMLVRHAQFRVAKVYDQDTSFFAEDLDTLLRRAGTGDDWAIVLVETSRFQERFEADPGLAVDSFERAMAAATRARLPDDTPYRFPDLVPLAWIQIPHVVTRAHVEAWLRLVESLPASARDWTSEGVSARSTCRILCDRIWLREAAKPDGEARWAETHEELDLVIRTARRMAFPYLEACALRGKITILFEQGRLPDEAAALASTFLATHGHDESCSLLIEDVLGRQYYHAGQHAEALAHLRRALKRRPEVEPYLLCLTANYASRAALVVEPEASIPFAHEAVRLARDGRDVPHLKQR